MDGSAPAARRPLLVCQKSVYRPCVVRVVSVASPCTVRGETVCSPLLVRGGGAPNVRVKKCEKAGGPKTARPWQGHAFLRNRRPPPVYGLNAQANSLLVPLGVTTRR